MLDSDLRALTDCQLTFMAHKDLWCLRERPPGIAALLWRVTLLDAAIYCEWVVNLGQRQAISRIAHAFSELMLRMEVAGLAQDRSCHLGLKQEDLGQATGLTLVHVNRILQDLIFFGRGILTGHDWDGLAHLGDFRPDYLHLSPASTV